MFMERVFRSLFLEQLKNALERLAPPDPSMPRPVRDMLSTVWRGFPRSERPECFAACDGSSGTAVYSGGITVWLLRAVCVSEKGAPDARVWVEAGHRLRGRGYALKALELELLADAAERLPSGSPVLHDGTLYPTLPPSPERLVKRRKYVERFLSALVRLLKTCLGRGLRVAGVSKDSDVSYLRVKLALDYLSSQGIHLGRERSLRRIVRELGRLGRSPAAEAVRNELEIPTSDQEEVEASTSGPGYTAPLVLAPHVLYLGEEIKAGTRDWWGSRVRARWLEYEELRPVVERLDELYELPPVYVTYWRPHHGLGVYRVDSLAVFHDGKWGDLSADRLSRDGCDEAERLMAMLNGLSPPPHTVKPLLDADELVRVKGLVFREGYEPVIRDALRTKGFYARPRRRVIRDLYLRRM